MDILITIIWSLPNIFMNQNITLSSFLIILQGKNYHPLLRTRLGRKSLEHVPGLGLHCSFLPHSTAWMELSSGGLESSGYLRIPFSKQNRQVNQYERRNAHSEHRGRATGIQRLKENYFLICWAPLLIAGGDNEKSPQKYLNWQNFKIRSWHSEYH